MNDFKAEVRGHPLVKGLLQSFCGLKPKFKALRDGEEMNVDDKLLKFIYTPWLH